MNDTIGENGLVPSFLVFGIIPRFTIISPTLPSQAEWMKLLAKSQMEMNAIVPERRISTALSKNVSAAADQGYYPGNEVLFYP